MVSGTLDDGDELVLICALAFGGRVPAATLASALYGDRTGEFRPFVADDAADGSDNERPRGIQRRRVGRQID